MLAVSMPLLSVAAEFCVIVPSVDLTVTGRLGTGFPIESAAATDSCHGPFGDPEYTGVARITILAAATTGVIVNCAPAEVPPPGVGVATVTVAFPAEASWAAGITAVSWSAESYVVCNAKLPKPTVETGTNPLPVTVIVVSVVPAATEGGATSERTGGG